MMQATIDWPNKEGILATTKICCVHLHTPSTRTYIDQTARISLVYKNGDPVMQPRHTPALESSDYFDGVKINDGANATFRVKINALSSQHKNAEFKFQVSIDDKTCTTASFKTLSKPIRAEKRKRSSVSDDAASTISATGEATDAASDDDQYSLSESLSDFELGALLDDMIPYENMSTAEIRKVLHDINLDFISISHKLQMIVRSLQNSSQD